MVTSRLPAADLGGPVTTGPRAGSTTLGLVSFWGLNGSRAIDGHSPSRLLLLSGTRLVEVKDGAQGDVDLHEFVRF